MSPTGSDPVQPDPTNDCQLFLSADDPDQKYFLIPTATILLNGGDEGSSQLAQMSGVDAFLHFVSFGECVRRVDLLRLWSPELGVSGRLPPRVALVCDAESCLDRLYGGFFVDWSCGGQWPRMMDFLATLVSAFQSANVQLAFFFNGALEPDRWKGSGQTPFDRL